MKFLTLCALLLTYSVSTFADGLDGRRQKMITDLEFIRGIFDTAYAPKEWKNRYLGWSLDREVASAKSQILGNENISTREYQQILRNFFRSTKDYHVGVYFHSTEQATLPFVVRGAQGRYFLVQIDRQKLSPEGFPFTEGDELISMDGQPVAQIVENIRVALDNGVPTTDQSLAELTLTNRRATSFVGPVPRGPVMLEFKRKADGKLVRRQLVWNYVAEGIPDWNGLQPLAAAAKAKFPKIEMVSPLAQEWMAAGPDAHPYSIGYRRGYLPALGEKIWESGKDKIFDAYIYRNEANKLIGYVRMPNYICLIMDEGRAEMKDPNDCLNEFAELMAKFEKVTDGIVIDQLNNPGGSVFYLYALASTLTDQPLYTPRHHMGVNQEDVAQALATLPALEKITNDEEAKKVLGPNMHGYPVTHQTAQYMINYLRFLVDEFKAGRKLTTPYYISGVDQINPHPTSRFTKPVLMLVNSLDFSGGDFFPAILQDNKRITVMGTRTAGAGGYVGGVSYPNLFGVATLRFTGSLAERIDRNPIENLGVTPDVNYEISVNDLQSNYSEYVKAIQTQISSMVN